MAKRRSALRSSSTATAIIDEAQRIKKRKPKPYKGLHRGHRHTHNAPAAKRQPHRHSFTVMS